MKEVQHLFTHFAFTQFFFENKVTDNLWNSLSASDKRIFPFQIKDVNW